MKANQYHSLRTGGYNSAVPADVATVERLHDATLEAAVLGALLLERQYVPDVRAIITKSAFYNESNAAIFDVICRLDDCGRTPDFVTVVKEARTAGVNPAYVQSLTSSVGSGVEVVNHARQLAGLELRRALSLFASELIGRAQTDAEAVEWAVAKLDEITGAATLVDTARPIGEVLADTLRDLERRQQASKDGRCVGIPTGLTKLDLALGGWRGGQLVILGARPAMGKTALALHFVRAAAASGVPVCVFSLEMPATQLAGRMLVGASGVNSGAFRAGNVTAEDWRRLDQSAGVLNPLPVYLDDTAATSMPKIRSICRAMQRKQRCGMVVVDYLQLIDTSDERGGNREREVAKISRGAKLLAKELNVPVILLAQLSRNIESENRKGNPPILADLRESGSIEQDADVVLFIDRPAYYSIDQIDVGSYGTIPSNGVGRLTVAKNREGATGPIIFRHNESLTRITDYDSTPEVDSVADSANTPF